LNGNGALMLKIVYINEIRRLVKEKRILMMILVTGFVMTYLPFQLFSKISELNYILNMAVEFYTVFYSMVAVFFIAYSANYNVFLQEKTNKTIHSLLSTPLDIKTIWFGKSLAIFTLGYCLSLVLSAIFITMINFMFSDTGVIVPSMYGFIALFLFNPVMTFSIVGIIGLLTLISRDETKVRIGTFLFIFALMLFLKPGRISMGLPLIPFQILISLILIAIVLLGLKLLTNDRVILSID
jgi:ABC-2 type transport system permease protein